MAAPQASGPRRGDRVELTAVPEDPDYDNAGLSAGDRGAVELVDSLRTVHIRWDSGRHLGITDRHRDLIRPIG
jgi:hypothetical protein